MGVGRKNDHVRARLMGNLLLRMTCWMKSLSYGVAQYGGGNPAVWIHQNGVKFKYKYYVWEMI